MSRQNRTQSNSKYLSTSTNKESKLANNPKQAIKNSFQRCKSLAKIGLAISIGTVSVLLAGQPQKAEATTSSNIVARRVSDSSRSKVSTENKLFNLKLNPLSRLNIKQNIYKSFSPQLPINKLDRPSKLDNTPTLGMIATTSSFQDNQSSVLVSSNWNSATPASSNVAYNIPSLVSETADSQNNLLTLPKAESKEYIFKIPALENQDARGEGNNRLVAQNRLAPVHIVRPGETLNQIAKKYGISRQQLIEANKIHNPNLIFVSQRLRIPQSNQLPSNVRANEQNVLNRSIVQNSDRLDNSTQSNLSPQVSGLDNSVTETEKKTIANPLGMTIQLSASVTPKLPPLSSPEQYLPATPAEFEGYIWPAKGTLTSGYGWRWGRPHKGVDIAAPIGTPIMAAASGEVISAGWNSGGYGNLVKVKHPNGSVTLYAHNHKIMVRRGQKVQQGQQIAQMGSTGFSTGSHLHFEIHPSGNGAVNPIAYLPKK